MRSTTSITLLASALALTAGCETTFNMADPQAGTGAGGTNIAMGGWGASGTGAAGDVAVGGWGASGTGGTNAAGGMGAGVGGGIGGMGAGDVSVGGMGASGVGAAGMGASGMGAAGTGAAGTGAAGMGASGVGAAGTGAAGTGAAGTGAAGTGAAGTGAAGTMAPPQTCPATSALQPGERTQQIQVGTLTRSFILHVPQSYTGQTPVPLILDWHGILMNSTLQRAFSGYADLSEKENFIVAFPEGTDTAFNVGICCTSSAQVDDVAFARAIAGYLSEQGCIDQKRIHSVGYSMGGGMSMHLACNAADLFASIAESAFDMMPEEDWPCAPSRPIPIISFRSTGDPIVPYNGAVNTIPPNGTPALVTFIGAKANFEKWAGLDGCTGSPMDLGGGCQAYSECAGGAEVELCTKQGGGHDYMPADAGWAFLKRHPMP